MGDFETAMADNIYLRMFAKKASRPNARQAFLATQHFRAELLALEFEVEQAALWVKLSEAYGRYVVDKLNEQEMHEYVPTRPGLPCLR